MVLTVCLYPLRFKAFDYILFLFLVYVVRLNDDAFFDKGESR